MSVACREVHLQKPITTKIKIISIIYKLLFRHVFIANINTHANSTGELRCVRALQLLGNAQISFCFTR